MRREPRHLSNCTLTRRTAVAAGLSSGLAAASNVRAASLGDWPVWQISSGKGAVYLTGETPPRHDDWSDPRTQSILLRCGSLWTETNNVAKSSPASLMQRYGVDPSKPLLDRLAPEDKQRLASAASFTHTPIEQLGHLRPWLAGYLLQQAYYRALELRGLTANQVLATSASKAGLAANSEFPTQDEAIAWFGALSAEADLQFLLYTLAEALRPRDDVEREEAAWSRGDLDSTTSDVAQMSRRYPDLYAAIIVRRNRNWAPRIRSMLLEPKPCLVVVGNFHLAGPDSVQAQLRAVGLRVRRV
jgi:uncharacterized protein YbaP (TraB family)